MLTIIILIIKMLVILGIIIMLIITCKVLLLYLKCSQWDFAIQTDAEIEHRRANIVIIDKKGVLNHQYSSARGS